jgi:hypothetical protein
MHRTGQIDLPLHSGRAPKWLFARMVLLAKCISEVIIIEHGREYFLKQISDPLWFQSFGCVLGFDWHSSGLTTTACGALKEAFRDLKDYGVYFCGGKGKTSRKTPLEIDEISHRICKDLQSLIYTSRIVAKIDNNALQDGFSLYHHTFIFTDDLKWTVVQQGMSDDNQGWARRYHWYCQSFSSLVSEPHAGIASDKSFTTVNLLDKDSDELRTLITELSGRGAEKNLKDIISLQGKTSSLPRRHQVLLNDVNLKYLEKIFLKTYEQKPADFEKLISLEGVGAKTLRALALIADLIYAKPISFKDPARYSFAHGGKDGYPYKINLADYERTINILEKCINKAKIETTDRVKALHRLYNFYNKQN